MLTFLFIVYDMFDSASRPQYELVSSHILNAFAFAIQQASVLVEVEFMI